MASKAPEIKKQIEYYLSDNNLKRDKFFRESISSAKEVTFCFKIYHIGMD